MDYFNIILENMSNTTDYVLIYEQATCIHEMLKEIDYWLKQGHSQQNSKGPKPFNDGVFSSNAMMSGIGNSSIMGSLKKSVSGGKCDLLDFDGGQNDSADDQISMSKMIHEQ